jgi:uncharacterized RDD family membrane protein YckC
MDYKHLLQPRVARVLQNASFLRRLGSFLIDLLIIDLIITAPFTAIFARFASLRDFTDVTYSGKELAAIVIVFMLIYAYYVLFEYLLGQTIGMMFMQTRVEGDGRIGMLLVRNSFILPFFPFVIFWIVEPVAVLFWRRSVLEKVTNTRTVYQRNIIL